MKHFVTLISLLSSAAMVAQTAPGFSITGRIPGLKAGSKIELINTESQSRVESTAADGSFEIKGSVDMPSLFELRFTNPEKLTDIKALQFMVENLPIQVSATHLDSLPLYVGTGNLFGGNYECFSIKAGEAQKEYMEYLETIRPYEKDSYDASYNMFMDEKRDTSPEGQKRLEEVYNKAFGEHADAVRKFQEDHAAYHFCTGMWTNELYTPFAHTEAEIQEIWNKVKTNNSPARLDAVRKAMEYARKYVKGKDYTDFALLDTEGNRHNMSEYIGKGKYVLIDFWASWCVPCRAAIPIVREIYKKYSDKVDIYAISIDQDEKAWRQAMEQEKMEWNQRYAPDEMFQAVVEPYSIKGIPHMVLIDPQGKIAYVGHNALLLTSVLDNI